MAHGPHPSPLRTSRIAYPSVTRAASDAKKVDLFGGFLGNYDGNIPSFDGACVNQFRWCDNLDNNDPEVLTFMSQAFADMVVRTAFDNKVMSASNNAVFKPKAVGAGSSRRLPAR